MRVLHARTLRYGEPLTAQTWVADFRRGLLTTRRLTLAGATSAVDACQEWAHVDTALLRISKAPDALIGAFPPELRTDEPAMPMLTRPVEAEATRMSFDVWFTWMDPLGHVNHPAYIDYCDEALARLVVSLGGDPHLIEPVAEELLFKRGLVAPEAATVTLRPVGLTSDGAWVLLAEVSFADGAVAATGTLVRRVPVALA